MLAEIITELQSLGVRFQEGIPNRKGGAGPADAGFLLLDGIPVSVPVSGPYVSKTPYFIEKRWGHAMLLKDGKEITPVSIISRPKFYQHLTGEGVPYSKIALLHGKDCLATSVIQTCVYWNSRQRCRFCGIQLSLDTDQTIPVKKPHQIAEVAMKAKELDSVSHVVLTTGTGKPPGEEISSLAQCAAMIKEATRLPVHAQLQPPPDLERLSELKEAGIDTVGIHIESFDPDVLQKIAPAKAAMGLEGFKRAWGKAVNLFGPNQVSSFLIAGLGERPASVISGSEIMADLGVYPFVVPLRPIPGSLMEDATPPDPGIMKTIYEDVADILKRKGLASSRSMAGCVRCGACSALHAYEQVMDQLVYHAARTEAELNQAFGIRKEVFVLEQGLFKDSDRDEYDPKGVHLVAELEGEVVGTVRVFPEAYNGSWIGGRLAVKRRYRGLGVGEALVRHAVRCVKRSGCTRFTALIQDENVPLFTRLGWKVTGPLKEYFGRSHRLMEADLDLNPGENLSSYPHGQETGE